MWRLAIRMLVLLWLLASLGLTIVVVGAMRQGYEQSWADALYEGFETIPEALMMGLGFSDSPLWIDAAYWLVLIICVIWAFSNRKNA